MASIEYIQKRIEGKQKELAALQKKLARIQKAEDSGWENNPYWYSERDKQYTLKDIDRAQEALAEWEQKLTQETQKSESRNIPAILEFLEGWKSRMKEYFEHSLQCYIEELDEWYKYDREYTDFVNHNFRDRGTEEYKQRRKEYEKARKEFYSKWNFIEPYIVRTPNGRDLDREKIQKDLDQEANAKYDFIIERTNAIVGQITDASGLYIGAKGELNGYIYGTDGTAEVETIGAGGYNIQCFHFRTLIKSVGNKVRSCTVMP